MIIQRVDTLETLSFGRLVPEQAKSEELLLEDILILYSKINEFHSVIHVKIPADH